MAILTDPTIAQIVGERKLGVRLTQWNLRWLRGKLQLARKTLRTHANTQKGNANPLFKFLVS